MSGALLIDTALLVLYIVGKASREYIHSHKRLGEFTEQDFDTLEAIVSRATNVVVTPNILTETSNLASMIGDPAKTRIREVFRAIVPRISETYVPSDLGVRGNEFLRLGLTDGTIVELSSPSVTVLTTDLDLYLAIAARGLSAINFNHLRDSYM